MHWRSCYFMKTLSVVVPTYNVEAYLGKCLDSLVVDREDLEVLVIIDGSKDKSTEIARSYQKRYPNIFRVIEKENGHYGSCINVGLSLAQGRYIKILDADDSYYPGFEDFVSFLSGTNADVVITDFVSVDDNGTAIFTSKFCSEEDIKEGRIEDLIKYGTQLFYHYELTYRTNILREINYKQTEGISYTDLEWSTLPFSIIKTYVYSPRIVYRYLRGRVGQSIDIKYRKNNMWMENKVVLGIVRQYEALKEKIAPANEAVLRTFVYNLVRIVYLHYLINSRGALKESELRTFDEDLREVSESIYQLENTAVDIRKYGSFYYIKDFRNKRIGYRIKYFYYQVCRYVGAVVEHIRMGKKGPLFIDNVH